MQCDYEFLKLNSHQPPALTPSFSICYLPKFVCISLRFCGLFFLPYTINPSRNFCVHSFLPQSNPIFFGLFSLHIHTSTFISSPYASHIHTMINAKPHCSLINFLFNSTTNSISFLFWFHRTSFFNHT